MEINEISNCQSPLYARKYKITDKLSVNVPTLRDIMCTGADDYYHAVYCFSAMPIDFMAQLDDLGIDFTKVTAYDVFLIMFPAIQHANLKAIFGDVDFGKFQYATNTENDEVVLVNAEDDIVIDRLVHQEISDVLRSVHHIKKDMRQPANDIAKQYMIERARKKLRRKKKDNDHPLDSMIIALVNTEQFKYNLETVLDLTIYQFMECMSQVVSKIDYDNRMHGVYAGTLDVKSLSQDDLTWLTHK